MTFTHKEAELYFPKDSHGGLSLTTDLCVSAHQDDIEIMCYGPIAACKQDPERHFMAVVVTDGAGSPRVGKFADYTDEEMKKVRITEQKKAAELGSYQALALLGYPSREIKDAENQNAVRELASLFLEARPERVYLHNFADKHDTHVAAALRALAALRSVRDEYQPKQLVLLEVWRSLDWLCDRDKVLYDTSYDPKLAEDILNVYESQIAGGKRYDLAAIGRRYANATFFESHATDEATGLSYGLDATELIRSEESPLSFINRYMDAFRDEVNDRLKRLGER